ncbi:MAG TPA: GNAT family N-acetyltransferase [Candidatus Limnocylindria bacterium]
MSEAEVRIRPARPSDAGPMVALINTYAAEDRMLERSESFVLANLADFLVAERDGTFRGCCALAQLTADLAEIRSLAVARDAGGSGVGRALVAACVTRARELALRRVFALTLVPEFFEKCGFTLTSLGRLPEKSAAECPVCPKRFKCDEHAMLMHLDGTVPVPLAPGEPVGYTRLFLEAEPISPERVSWPKARD